tara:strand:+ start:5278 stop:5535 length:258 start_codon:yes stop_codon:yes gene_type:complete
MGTLIFMGTAAIVYIVFDRLSFSKENIIFPKKIDLNKLELNNDSKIINANISDDKLILTIKFNEQYKIIIYNLKDGKELYSFEIN